MKKFKRFTLVLVFILVLFLLCACSNNTTTSEEDNNMNAAFEKSALQESGDTADSSQNQNGSNVLVAYFSRAGENYAVGTIAVGNTQKVAEIISDETGGNLFHIQTVSPYPESYDECLEVAQQEKNENARPKLDAVVDNFDSYDTIYLGYPIWWSDLPMPVYTFLESYDFSGKNIYPFSTNEGSGLSGTVDDIKKAVPNATVHDGLAIRGTTAQNDPEETKSLVTAWLDSEK